MNKNTLAAVALAASALFGTSAHATMAMVIANANPPTVQDLVIQLSPSSWSYSYTVFNNYAAFNPPLTWGEAYTTTDYLVPYFTGAGITSIQSPTGWTYNIDPADTFGLGFGAQTLHWHANTLADGIAPTILYSLSTPNSLSGFSYLSAYAPVYGPFAAIDGAGRLEFGDPALPGSPDAIAAGLQPVASVPEPETYTLLLAGLGLMGAVNRRRKSKQA